MRIRWMVYGMLATLVSGFYNVAASSDHTSVVYWTLEQGMQASLRRQAMQVPPPPQIDEALLRKGALCYAVNCVQCHGGPGVAPGQFSMGLLPAASNLTQTARDWPIEHIYWVTRNGIRMTAMPAWEFRVGERELWAIAAFVDQELPRLTAAQYRERIGAVRDQVCELPSKSTKPDAQRGLLTIRQYGCHGCHIIPQVTGPEVHVGPSLAGFARRALIAGVLPNTADNLVHWLQEPHSIRPRSLMPDLGVTEQHARDIHAFLATLE
jgi:mono/diheme cytochrome c family protein